MELCFQATVKGTPLTVFVFVFFLFCFRNTVMGPEESLIFTATEGTIYGV